MGQESVELHDQALVVRRVAVDDHRDALPHLSARGRESVRPLDLGQVAVLQHRAGAARDVAQHSLDPAPSTQARPRRALVQQSLCGRTPAADGTSEHADDVERPRLARCDLDDRVVVPLPRWALAPLHALVEPSHAVDDDAGSRRGVTRGRHGDLDRPDSVGPSHTLVGCERGHHPTVPLGHRTRERLPMRSAPRTGGPCAPHRHPGARPRARACAASAPGREPRRRGPAAGGG